MKKGKSFLSLFLVIAVTVLFGVSCMYGVDLKGTGAAKNINLGLDLEGGVSITYQVKGDNPSQKDMDDTVYKLQKRVEQYSTEAQAYQVGDNRISIEIPGVNDANAILEELGQPGSLYFIKHKNGAGEENYTLGSSGYVLNKTIDELKESDSIVLSGSEVKTASAGQISDSTTGSKEYGVDLELTTEGAEKFKEATQEAVSNCNDTIAIYYDGELISVPKVNTVIENGKAQITGSMTYEEADNIASTIRIGGLNVELEEVNRHLRSTNLDLSESNLIKEAYIARFFKLCSVYVDRLQAYRKLVNKKLQRGQVAELLKMTHLSNDIVTVEVQELYANFDSAFLHLFPNFVESLNALLLPEEQIVLKPDELLNTELRIFALIRLGIKDSSQIAELLHYSVNTIYNYRSRVKTKARVSREDFEELVAKIR